MYQCLFSLFTFLIRFIKSSELSKSKKEDGGEDYDDNADINNSNYPFSKTVKNNQGQSNNDNNKQQHSPESPEQSQIGLFGIL